MDKLKKVQGCLVGGALGDAVGSPVEKKGRIEVEEYLRKHFNPQDFKGVIREHGNLPFGQYTDDTQLTKEIALSLIHSQENFLEEFGSRLQNIVLSRKIVGSGGTTRQAAKNLSKGISVYNSGVPSSGNGSAMRAAPLGIYFDTTEDIKKYSILQSQITHKGSEAAAGAAVIALATHWLLTTDDEFNYIAFFIFLAEEIKDIDKTFCGALDWVRNNFNKDLITLREGVMGYQKQTDWPGISPFVISAVLWSLISFAINPENYWETLKTAIWVTGDVDSIASMAGNLSGTYLGLDAIPKHLAFQINDKGEFGYEYLLQLGTQLIDI